MRVEDVPQEGNATLEGQRKGMYAVGSDGRIALVPSRGWEAEELVTTAAVEHFEALAQRALVRVRRGAAGALEYFMYARRLDPPTLARASGIWRWRVRRHLRRPFARIPVALQERYAEVLGVPRSELLDFRPDIDNARPGGQKG
ncbi:MAG TPA: hypothetical protein VMG60_06410 [Burkholderiaceae bacterium]|nr:hypothetical protein [Burkholderiaceae bacterium]